MSTLLAVLLLGGIALVSLVMGAEFGDPVRRVLHVVWRWLCPPHKGTRTPHVVRAPRITPAQAAAHADQMHRTYAPAADAQRPVNGRTLGTQPRETPEDAGLPTVEEMRAEYFASPACPWLPAQQPAWPAPPEPEWPDVTMSDLSPARYVPDVPDTCCPPEAEPLTYGQVPVARVLEAERLAGAMRS